MSTDSQECVGEGPSGGRVRTHTFGYYTMQQNSSGIEDEQRAAAVQQLASWCQVVQDACQLLVDNSKFSVSEEDALAELSRMRQAISETEEVFNKILLVQVPFQANITGNKKTLLCLWILE